MAARCSPTTACAAREVDAVVLCLCPVPAEPDAERDAAAGEMVERGDLLGQEDRVVLGGEQDARAEPDARGDGGGRGQRDERVEAALVVVEADALDEGGRQVLAHGQVRVLGQPERVEAQLLDRDRQRGRRQVAVGEGGGDAEPHGQAGGALAAKSARVPACAAPPSSAAKARLFAAVGLARRRRGAPRA